MREAENNKRTCQYCKFWKVEDWDDNGPDLGGCSCNNSESHDSIRFFDEGCEEWEQFEGTDA